MSYFSVDYVLFEIVGYPMSLIELLGTLAYLWSVWLIAQRNMLTWPVGIVAVALYMSLFYQIRLYADAVEQVYYLAASVYGWWYWWSVPRESESATGARFSAPAALALWGGITLFLTVMLAISLTRVHELAPMFFPEPASLPWLDALTTVMSLVAMWLMVRKRTESWVYWIGVDVIGIGLYWEKDVRFVALLYVVLLVLALRGLWVWTRVGTTACPTNARVQGSEATRSNRA